MALRALGRMPITKPAGLIDLARSRTYITVAHYKDDLVVRYKNVHATGSSVEFIWVMLEVQQQLQFEPRHPAP